MSDLEAKLRIELDAASRRVGGAGIDRACVDDRVRQRADHRRRRRRTLGALGAGLFVVLVVGAAVGLAQERSSKTVDQPEDFGPFCLVARKIQNGGNDVTGLSQQDADAKSRNNLLALRAAAPGSLKPSFDLLLDVPTTQAEAASMGPDLQRKVYDADRAIESALRDRYRLTAVLGQTVQSSTGTGSDTKHNSTGSCLEGAGWSICLEGVTGELAFRATGLEPGSLVKVEVLPLTGSSPTIGVVEPNGSYAGGGTLLFRNSNAVRVNLQVTFTPAGSTERTQVLNA